MSVSKLVVYNEHNNPVTLESIIKDQPTLLFFLRNPGCAICRSKLFELRDNAAMFQDNGINIVAITLVPPIIMASLKETYHLGFAMYSDFRGALYDEYNFNETALEKFNDPEVVRQTELAESRGIKVTDARGVSVTQLGGLVLYLPGQEEPTYIHVADPIYNYPAWQDVLDKALPHGKTASL